MIGKLTGRVDSISTNHLVIDVQGVGYVVACSAHTLRQLGGKDAAVSLLIETQVREDAINLYGFADSNERDWFRMLTTVQGVGSKSALAILSSISPDQLVHAIAAQDKNALTQADGVGPKLALRIVTELKDKVASLATPAIMSGGVAALRIAGNSDTSDAVSALVNLGYKRMDAFAAISAAAQNLGEDAKIDALIRAGLAELSKRDNIP